MKVMLQILCMPPTFLQVSLELSTSVPLFNYTSIPLDTAQCTSFADTCSAMQAITDQNAFTFGGMCTLSADCLTITCIGGEGITITTTLSPCDYAVTLSISGGYLNFSQKFTESGVGTVYVFEQLALLIDVTLARLQDGAVGLQVRNQRACSIELKFLGCYV